MYQRITRCLFVIRITILKKYDNKNNFKIFKIQKVRKSKIRISIELQRFPNFTLLKQESLSIV